MNQKFLGLLFILLTLTANALPATYTPLKILQNTIRTNAHTLLQQFLTDNDYNDVNRRDDYGWTLLLFAADIGCSLECLNVLLAKGADTKITTPKQQYTALHLAAMWGRTLFLEKLIAHGADVHARDTEQMTPLHHALDNGYQACAKILINHSAKQNAKTMQENTPTEITECRKD